MCIPTAAVQCYSVAAIFAVTGVAAVSRHPVTVVVSFDGFRPDYIQPDATPTMARFRDASAAPPYMRSAFPTKTFVNHFTMATGMHPETHGVLDNYMFDRHNKTMHYTYEQFHYDDSLVPIWMQNEYNGEGRHSGVMMWPGSEFPYQSKNPTYTEVYNNSIHWNTRIDTIMSWIEDENRPANLVFAYFEEPDRTGHKKGVSSQEIKNQIARVENTVKYMLEQINYKKLEKEINLIILSDHGMDTVTYDRIIFLDNYVSNMTYKSIITGPNAFILPNMGKFDEVFTNLSNGANISNTFYVFKKYQLPDRWHMKNNPRLNGIIYLLAKPGYAFWYSFYQTILDQTTKEMFKVGTHGYDNDDPQMRALFIGSGPMFKRNFTALPFDNVDLYPLISHLLALKQPTNDTPHVNGTIAGVEQLLVSPKSSSADTLSPHILPTIIATVIDTMVRLPNLTLP
ncbi:ectonucleotide pyrophosphatase/phosphodiesterase family member 5-like [Melanaphis sacchari]|uniref:ectonucleotide pyrophosphatase/phosphodiesterase family member 5-like n=1 Tax=Melanaphis sacchari TaxID=742174 RepID=UPI000DC157C0|nr:ectonucleotide pyrophosphatase/phosphodiesterase family member 5-like [Melanaphis sacchari]XP_025204852.1 ectonucleotide pyrophosphatase/phosphodiesterase family member 5-like [Melanaphis sacchari]XP_025204853.1 ectonucleotide pyrophosphatase/phosphodiesterase family member 5-like [Melanaphis sacchari]